MIRKKRTAIAKGQSATRWNVKECLPTFFLAPSHLQGRLFNIISIIFPSANRHKVAFLRLICFENRKTMSPLAPAVISIWWRYVEVTSLNCGLKRSLECVVLAVFLKLLQNTTRIAHLKLNLNIVGSRLHGTNFYGPERKVESSVNFNNC